MRATVIDAFGGVPALRTSRAGTGSKHTSAPSGSRTDARAKGRVANSGAPRRSEVSGDIDATAGERGESMTAAAQLGHGAGRPILVTGATGQQVGPSCATSARTQSSS
jgi:hypothetical protein